MERHIYKDDLLSESWFSTGKQTNIRVRFQVLAATIMKVAIFCDVAPCGLILTGVSEVHTAFNIRVSHLKTSVNIYQTTQRNIPEDSHLQTNIKIQKRNKVSFINSG
jgi:hypothetical protein